MWRAQPAPDDLSRFYPDGAEYAVLEGVVAEGSVFPADDPAAYLAPELRAREDGAMPSVFRAPPPASRSFILAVEEDLASGRAASGRMKVYAEGDGIFLAGDRLRLTCRLASPAQARNPGEVDMARIYGDKGIRLLAYTRSEAVVERLGVSRRFMAQRLSDGARRWVSERVGARMERRSAMLLNCLVLGDRSALSPELRENFLRSGTVHLLVVSGLHVMVLGLGAMLLCRLAGLSAKWRFTVVAAVALVYLFITGVQLATLRAVSVVMLFAWAEWRERRADFLNLLAASAVIVLLRDPLDLFSAGFMLSYLSVTALALFMPRLLPPRRAEEADAPPVSPAGHVAALAGKSLLASSVATAATWPLVLRGWNIFAPAALAVNVVVLPILMLILGGALLLPLAAFDPAAAVLAHGFDALFRVLDVIVERAARIPWGHVYLPAPPLWWVCAYLILLGLLCVAGRLPRGRVWIPAALVLLAAALPWTVPGAAARSASRASGGGGDGERLAFLDVRQGGCVVLESGGGALVYDCGSQGRPHVGSWTVVPYLLSRGHWRVDVLALSHADADHINGAAELADRLPVRELWVSADFESGKSGREALAWLRPRVERVRVVRIGERIGFGDASVAALWPDAAFVGMASGSSTPSNEGSLVLRVEVGGISALLTGDAEDVATAGMDGALEPVDVLVAPHHGSAFAGQAAFLKRVNPRHVILSAREDFPAAETLARYGQDARLWKTFEGGAIIFERPGDGRPFAPRYWLK